MVPIIEIDRHVLPALPLQVETEGAGQPKVGGGSHSYTSTVPCASWSIRERFVRFGIEPVLPSNRPPASRGAKQAVWPVAIRPTGGSQRSRRAAAQEVADEPLEGRGPRAPLAAVGPRVVAVARASCAARERLVKNSGGDFAGMYSVAPELPARPGARHAQPTLAWRVPRVSWKAREPPRRAAGSALPASRR